MAKKHSYDYYDAFVRLVDYSCSAASMLNEALHNFDPARSEELMRSVHEIEHAADTDKHKLMQVLIHEFLPPIEREDIVTLAQGIDNVADAIEDVAMKIYMFNIQEIIPEALEFMDLIVACCAALKKAIQEFRNFKKSNTLNDYVIEINDLESKADHLYTETIRNLHMNSSDPVKMMVWYRTLNYFEDCCDACEDVADALENVVMKNS